MNELESNIKNTVAFKKLTPSGFNTLKCPVCNDTKVRAGFKFDEDKIIYQCFRGKCDATTVYEYAGFMNHKFRNLLKILGVEVPVKMLTDNVKEKKKPKEFNNTLYKVFKYQEIKLKPQFDVAPKKKYQSLLRERCVELDSDLYVGTKDMWKYRLIIPFYHNNKLIGWQGYDKSNTYMPYLNSSGNDNLLFINTKGGIMPKQPIVVEGVFDAWCIPNGVAALDNTVSKEQAYLFRNSRPILVPDRKDSNYLKIAKEYGWRISIPSWKEKDVNAAVQHYGKLVVAKMIHDGIESNILKAEMKYKIWKI